MKQEFYRITPLLDIIMLIVRTSVRGTRKKNEYGNGLTFWRKANTQNISPYPSADESKKCIKKYIKKPYAKRVICL